MSFKSPPIFDHLEPKYEYVRTLGKGGMAEVYLARQRSLDREVAIKVLLSDFAAAASFLERFRQEGRIIARLAHENIIVVHDIEEIGETFCIIMEYLEGWTLGEILSREGAMPAKRLLAMVEQVGRALTYAHSRGILHRDVKPENVFVLSGDRVKLLDFGIAREKQASGLTKSGMTIGTPLYMSPEQARGEELDERSDLYSLALIAWTGLTGRFPFENRNEVALALEKSSLPPPPSQFQPALAPALDEILLTALAPKREDRYSSVESFLQALTEFSHDVLPSRPIPAAQPTRIISKTESRLQTVVDASGLSGVASLGASEADEKADARRFPTSARILYIAVPLLIVGVTLAGLTHLLYRPSDDASDSPRQQQAAPPTPDSKQAEALFDELTSRLRPLYGKNLYEQPTETIQALETDFHELLDLDPDNPKYLSFFGVFLLNLQRFPEAEQQLSKALELIPSDDPKRQGERQGIEKYLEMAKAGETGKN